MSEGFNRPFKPVLPQEAAFWLPVVRNGEGFWFGICSSWNKGAVTHYETGLLPIGKASDTGQLLGEVTWTSPRWQTRRFEGQLSIFGVQSEWEEEGIVWLHSSCLDEGRYRSQLSPLLRSTIDAMKRTPFPGDQRIHAAKDCPECLLWDKNLTVFPMCTPTLPPATHTNTSILGTDWITIVDPGSAYPGELARLCAELECRLDAGGKVVRIILTHHHADHVGGVTLLQDRFDVPVAAHPFTRERLFGRVRVDEDIADGDRFALDAQEEVVALWTPGHASGHLVLWNEGREWMIAGDMVAGHGTIVIDPPEGDMEQYLEQLDRLRQLSSRVVIPAHGSPITSPNRLFTEYIEHRLMREHQIVKIIGEEGRARTGGIVSRIYTQLDPRAIPLAIRQVLAHLIKLEREGRVIQDGRDWWALPGLD